MKVITSCMSNTLYVMLVDMLVDVLVDMLVDMSVTFGLAAH